MRLLLLLAALALTCERAQAAHHARPVQHRECGQVVARDHLRITCAIPRWFVIIVRAPSPARGPFGIASLSRHPHPHIMQTTRIARTP